MDATNHHTGTFTPKLGSIDKLSGADREIQSTVMRADSLHLQLDPYTALGIVASIAALCSVLVLLAH